MLHKIILGGAIKETDLHRQFQRSYGKIISIILSR